MTVDIPENDHGQIRVFAFKGSLPSDTTPDLLERLFGTDKLDLTYVDIINIDDLSSMSLTDYIAQGYDVDVEPHDIPAINGIEGYAVLVLSRAAQGRRVKLDLAKGLRHITTYVPPAQLTPIEPLSSTSAEGIIGDPPAKPAKSDARIGGMVATIALIVMFLLVGLMIWVA